MPIAPYSLLFCRKQMKPLHAFLVDPVLHTLLLLLFRVILLMLISQEENSKAAHPYTSHSGPGSHQRVLSILLLQSHLVKSLRCGGS